MVPVTPIPRPSQSLTSSFPEHLPRMKTLKIHITIHIKLASKTYKNTSCLIKKPSFPCIYSTILNPDLAEISPLTTYRILNILFQGALRCLEREVGWREIRRWKINITRMKRFMNKI
jgi:hypothetical protein